MDAYKLLDSGIDYNEGLRRFANDEEIYNKVLLMFIEDDNFEKMEKAIAEKNYDRAFLIAHALKGETGNMSLNRLYTQIVLIVEQMRNKNYSDIETLVAKAKKSYETAIEAIKNEISPPEEKCGQA